MSDLQRAKVDLKVFGAPTPEIGYPHSIHDPSSAGLQALPRFPLGNRSRWAGGPLKSVEDWKSM